MTSREFSYRFTVDIADLVNKFQAIQKESQRTQAELDKIGQSGAAGRIDKSLNLKQGLAELQRLKNLFDQLAIARDKALVPRRNQLGQFTAPTAANRPLVPAAVASEAGIRQAASVKEIEAAMTNIDALAGQVKAKMDAGTDEWVAGINAGKALLGEAAITAGQFGEKGFSQVVKQVLSGQKLQELAADRVNALERQRVDLIKEQARLKGQVERLAGGRNADRVQRENTQLERDRGRAAERVLAAQNAINAAEKLSTTTKQEQLRLQQKLQEALFQQARVEDQAFKRGGVESTNAIRLQESGLQSELANVDAQLDQVIDQIFQLKDGGVEALKILEAAVPGVTRAFQTLTNTARLLENLLKRRAGVDKQSKEYEALSVRIDRASKKQRELTRTVQEFGQQVKESPDLQVTPSDIKAQLGLLERTLVGAFDGFGRRFQTTLQFAFSAAIIFGVQRLARELVQTAIDVERAFADIESALEFDIAFDRGTAEFNSEVEEVRRGILGAAQDLNVLPTVANEIAFKMVARFRDVDRAVQATRAQMLALKISTIESGEVLRALTAVAEGFASATLTMNSELSLQERLLRQEEAALTNYAKALDLATQIQQTWGVEVEDSLEGTARATEVFSQLGFSMEETMAIVAAVSQRLGQTGQVLAEKLVRSIGQITSPKIKDQLLELAANTEALSLTFEDFDSGANVVKTLLNQFDRLQAIDPRAANELFQIIGQRREVEVVATLFGTQEIQEQIISTADGAVGAAERRFSFLETTVSEILKSLAAGFQEFAQNLERLGALNPFKLVLSTADQLLTVINAMLKGVVGLINAVDRLGILRIGDFGFSQLLTTIASLSLATRTLKRLLEAAAKAHALLGPAQAAGAAVTGRHLAGRHIAGRTAATGAVVGTAGAEALRRLGAAAIPLQKVFKNVTRTISTQAAIGAAEFQRLIGFRSINTALIEKENAARVKGLAALGAAEKSALFFAGKLLLIVAAVALVGTWISAIQSSKKALEDWTDAVDESRTRVDRQILEENITDPLKQEALRTADALETLRNIADKETSFGDRLATNTRAVEDLSQEEFISRARFAGLGEEAAIELFEWFRLGWRKGEDVAKSGPVLDIARQLQPGTEEFFSSELAQRLRDKAIADLRLAFDEAAALVERSGDDPVAQRGLRSLGKRQQIALARLAAAETPEEFESAQRNAEGVLTQSLQLMNFLGGLASQLEVAFGKVQREFEQTQRDLERGTISPTTALAEFDRLEAEALNAASRTVDDEQERFLKQAAEIHSAFNQAVLDRFSRNQAFIDETEIASEASRRKLISLRNVYQTFLSRGDFSAASDVLLQIIQAEREFVDALVSEAERRLSIANLYANGIDDQIKALQDFLARLLAIRELQFPSGGVNELQDFKGFSQDPAFLALVDQIIKTQTQIEGLIDQRAVREVIAKTQASGKVLGQLTALNSQLAGAREKLNQAKKGSLEALEALNEVNRVIANIALNTLQAAQAYTLFAAGTNNSIARLKAELTNVAKELALAKELYDENSAQYFQLKLRQEELRTSLANALLNLRDLNRRLDSDVTNAFEQAQLDLIQILERLAAPDLGELERAQLELEKKNAEAAAEQAFFDDRLFQLQFAHETGEIGTGAYVAALRRLLETVDTSTRQGQEIFLQIQGLIDGMVDDVNNLAFNIPASIKLPTLFEVRRALAADQLGVNYQDNRQQEININVDDALTLEQVIEAVDSALGQGSARTTAGGAGITIGGFT